MFSKYKKVIIIVLVLFLAIVAFKAFYQKPSYKTVYLNYPIDTMEFSKTDISSFFGRYIITDFEESKKNC